MQNFWVVPASSGRWVVKPEGSQVPSTDPAEYEEALTVGRRLVDAAGGGFLVVIDAGGEVHEHAVPAGVDAEARAPRFSTEDHPPEGALERARRRRAVAH